MKRFSILSFSAVALLATLSFVQPVRAAHDSKVEEVASPDAVTVVDPGEEAQKIRHLVKLALANNATAVNRDLLSEEIATVEKNKRLKQDVVTSLLQDDNPDPTLPKVTLVKYKDGSIRGILFTQTDDVRNNNPNKLAWPLDAKRERKEQSR